MHSLPKILVIHSSAEQQAFKRILKANYDVHNALEENDYISETCAFGPDLVIIDVFDDDNKVQILERLRNTSELSETAFLLASPESGIEEIKKTYDYTSDDFLTTPANRKDLTSKVRSKIKRAQELHHLSTQLAEKDDNAYIALNEAYEMGVIIQFYRSCFSCSNPHDIIGRLFLVGKELELKMSVYVHHNDETVFASNRDNRDTSYKNVMHDALNKGRYVDMGPTTIINYDYISVLVHNMPVKHPKKYGQLKDHLSMLTSGANCCLEYMEADEILQAQHKKHTAHMAEASCTVLIEVDEYFREDLARKRKIIESSFSALQEQLSGLSNNSDKELSEQIKSQIKITQKTIIADFERDKDGNEPLDIVLQGLKKILIYTDDPLI